jgi:hypothetical protein
MGLLNLFKPLYAGGDGSSPHEAIVINASSSATGISAEYKWLESRYGSLNKDWEIIVRMHGSVDGIRGKTFEFFDIKLADGTEKTIVFDISSFFGRH